MGMLDLWVGDSNFLFGDVVCFRTAFGILRTNCFVWGWSCAFVFVCGDDRVISHCFGHMFYMSLLPLSFRSYLSNALCVFCVCSVRVLCVFCVCNLCSTNTRNCGLKMRDVYLGVSV